MLTLPHRRALSGGAWIRDPLWRKAQAVPLLDIDFAGTQSLIDRISGQNVTTFSRTGTKTFVGSSGTFQTAAINECPLVYDPVTLRCLGVQPEASRTNVLLNSDTLSTQSVAVTAQAYTLSFYGTGSITLSGTASATLTGTGAFPTRVTLTFTPTAGTLTLTVSGSVRFAQLEAGPNATTYIPTTVSTANRVAEALYVGGSQFNAIYTSGTPITVYVEAIPNTAIVNGAFASLNDGASANRASARNNSATAQFLCQTASVTDAQPGAANALTNNTLNKIAFTMRPNFANIFANAVSGVADTSFNIPTHTRLSIGGEGAASAGHVISRIVVWNKELAASITA